MAGLRPEAVYERWLDWTAGALSDARSGSMASRASRNFGLVGWVMAGALTALYFVGSAGRGEVSSAAMPTAPLAVLAGIAFYAFGGRLSAEAFFLITGLAAAGFTGLGELGDAPTPYLGSLFFLAISPGYSMILARGNAYMVLPAVSVAAIVATSSPVIAGSATSGERAAALSLLVVGCSAAGAMASRTFQTQEYVLEGSRSELAEVLADQEGLRAERLRTRHLERESLASRLEEESFQTLGAWVALLKKASLLEVDGEPAEARAAVLRAKEGIASDVRGLRQVMSGLRPPDIEGIGLRGALEEVAVRLGVEDRVTFDAAGDDRGTPGENLAVYRIAEAILEDVIARCGVAAVRFTIESGGPSPVVEIQLDLANDPRRAGLGGEAATLLSQPIATARSELMRVELTARTTEGPAGASLFFALRRRAPGEEGRPEPRLGRIARMPWARALAIAGVGGSVGVVAATGGFAGPWIGLPVAALMAAGLFFSFPATCIAATVVLAGLGVALAPETAIASGTAYWAASFEGVFLAASVSEVVRRRSRDLERGRERLEEAVAESRALLGEAVELGEAERSALAGDLHDGPIQGLSAAVIMLGNAATALERDDRDRARQSISRVRTLLPEEGEALRKIISGLAVVEASGSRLDLALKNLAREVLPGGSPVVKLDLEEMEVPGEVVGRLYRVAHEALVNVGKHSGATEVEVLAQRQGDWVELVICDNGCGFDPGRVSSTRDREEHIGMALMGERAAAMGGSVEVISARGGGAKVVARLPAGGAAEAVATATSEGD